MSTPASIISSLYLAYYSRPADPSGLRFWTQRLEAQGNNNLDAIINAFATSPEAQARFGGLSINGFIDQVYQSLFARPAESGGLAYWSGLIQQGALTRGQATLAILQGAQNGQAQDSALVNLRNDAALQFTQSLGSSGTYFGNAAADAATLLIASVQLGSSPSQINNLVLAANQLVQMASAQPDAYNTLLGTGHHALGLLNTPAGRADPLGVIQTLGNILDTAVQEAGPNGNPSTALQRLLGEESNFEDVLINLPNGVTVQDVNNAVSNDGLAYGGRVAETGGGTEPPQPGPVFTVTESSQGSKVWTLSTGHGNVVVTDNGTSYVFTPSTGSAVAIAKANLTGVIVDTITLSGSASVLASITNITGAVTLTNPHNLAQLKAINNATTGAITLFDKTVALSGVAADVAAALNGIIGYTGTATFTNAASIGQWDTVDTSTSGSVSGKISDTILAANGKNFTTGYTGNTGVTLTGSDGDQTVTGSAHADTITGGAGADTIDGGGGNDTVSYADVTATTSHGLANLSGMAINLSSASITAATVATAMGGTIVLGGGSGVAGADLAAGTAGYLATAAGDSTTTMVRDTLASIENVTGSALGDYIVGSDSDNTITGGSGADVLTGGLGADTFVFAAGDSLQASMDVVQDFQASGTDKLQIAGLSHPGVVTVDMSSYGSFAALVAAGNVRLGSYSTHGSVFVGRVGTDVYVITDSASHDHRFIANDTVVKLVGVSISDMDHTDFVGGISTMRVNVGPI